jgi:hypothetical protein
MIKTAYRMWLKELEDKASNDDQIQSWIKEFVKFADKLLTPKKKGDTIGFSVSRRHFIIRRDE